MGRENNEVKCDDSEHSKTMKSIKICDLRKMGIAQIKRFMNDAGVCYDKKEIIKKEDMIEIIIKSGRVVIPSSSSEEEKPQKSENTCNFGINISEKNMFADAKISDLSKEEKPISSPVKGFVAKGIEVSNRVQNYSQQTTDSIERKKYMLTEESNYNDNDKKDDTQSTSNKEYSPQLSSRPQSNDPSSPGKENVQEKIGIKSHVNTDLCSQASTCNQNSNEVNGPTFFGKRPSGNTYYPEQKKPSSNVEYDEKGNVGHVLDLDLLATAPTKRVTIEKTFVQKTDRCEIDECADMEVEGQPPKKKQKYEKDHEPFNVYGEFASMSLKNRAGQTTESDGSGVVRENEISRIKRNKSQITKKKKRNDNKANGRGAFFGTRSKVANKTRSVTKTQNDKSFSSSNHRRSSNKVKNTKMGPSKTMKQKTDDPEMIVISDDDDDEEKEDDAASTNSDDHLEKVPLNKEKDKGKDNNKSIDNNSIQTDCDNSQIRLGKKLVSKPGSSALMVTSIKIRHFEDDTSISDNRSPNSLGKDNLAVTNHTLEDNDDEDDEKINDRLSFTERDKKLSFTRTMEKQVQNEGDNDDDKNMDENSSCNPIMEGSSSYASEPNTDPETIHEAIKEKTKDENEESHSKNDDSQVKLEEEQEDDKKEKLPENTSAYSKGTSTSSKSCQRHNGDAKREESENWIVPEEIPQKSPRIREFYVQGSHITLEVRPSEERDAGEGLFLTYHDDTGSDKPRWTVPTEGVDLGIYARGRDRKNSVVFEAKNFCFNYKPQEWSYQSAREGEKLQGDFFDITDDKTGTVHDEAMATLLPKVNEVSHSKRRKRNVYQFLTPNDEIHYVLEGGEGFWFLSGKPKELLTHYGKSYDDVRLRKYDNNKTTNNHNGNFEGLSCFGCLNNEHCSCSSSTKQRRDRVPAFYHILQRVSIYTEDEIRDVIEFFTNRDSQPQTPEARFRMHWLVETIQRYRAEVFVDGLCFADTDDKGDCLTSKIEELLEKFPLNHEERKTMMKNEHLGTLVRMCCGEESFATSCSQQQRRKMKVGVVEDVWTDEEGRKKYLVCFGENNFQEVTEDVVVNNWIRTSFGATVHLHL